MGNNQSWPMAIHYKQLSSQLNPGTHDVNNNRQRERVIKDAKFKYPLFVSVCSIHAKKSM